MACRFEMDCHNLVEEFLHLGKLENKIRACSQALRDGLVPEPLSPAGALCDGTVSDRYGSMQALHFVLKESNSAINSR